MDKENNTEVEVDSQDDTDTKSVNWESKYERLRSARSTDKQKFESEIAELKSQLKQAPKEVKEIKSEFGLLEEAYLAAKNIEDADEVELIKKWQKDTGKGLKEVVDHPFVKTEIEKLRQAKANQLATANVRSDSKGDSKDDVESWLSKGELPERTPANKKLRQKILNEKLRREKDGSAGGKFYND